MDEVQKLQGLADLIDEMRRLKTPFNAVIIPSGVLGNVLDVARLKLVDNATEWEACYETGTYDLWKDGDLVEYDLSRSQAAQRLIDEYRKAKMEKMVRRMKDEIKELLVIPSEVYRALPELERLAADALQQTGKVIIQEEKHE
jgi:hypothetical protein